MAATKAGQVRRDRRNTDTGALGWRRRSSGKDRDGRPGAPDGDDRDRPPRAERLRTRAHGLQRCGHEVKAAPAPLAPGSTPSPRRPVGLRRRSGPGPEAGRGPRASRPPRSHGSPAGRRRAAKRRSGPPDCDPAPAHGRCRRHDGGPRPGRRRCRGDSWCKAGPSPPHIKPRVRRLFVPSGPTMTWSWTVMSKTLAASTIRRVMSISARDGVGSPEG